MPRPSRRGGSAQPAGTPAAGLVSARPAWSASCSAISPPPAPFDADRRRRTPGQDQQLSHAEQAQGTANGPATIDLRIARTATARPPASPIPAGRPRRQPQTIGRAGPAPRPARHRGAIRQAYRCPGRPAPGPHHHRARRIEQLPRPARSCCAATGASRSTRTTTCSRSPSTAETDACTIANNKLDHVFDAYFADDDLSDTILAGREPSPRDLVCSTSAGPSVPKNGSPLTGPAHMPEPFIATVNSFAMSSRLDRSPAPRRRQRHRQVRARRPGRAGHGQGPDPGSAHAAHRRRDHPRPPPQRQRPDLRPA